MRCVETRTRNDGIKRRTYKLDDGRKMNTFELPATVVRGVGLKKIQEQMRIWMRGEKQRAESHKRRQRIEGLLRERVKPLAIADEVGVTETRVRQIRKEMGL